MKGYLMALHPLAGKPAPESILCNIPRLVSNYYCLVPDAAETSHRVAFGTSGHRGCSDKYSFNERHILALHYSRNCIDWCLAGIVARGENPQQARHYASMCVDGDDLHVLSRSGDHRAHSAHDGNLITFHTVKNFRDLVCT